MISNVWKRDTFSASLLATEKPDRQTLLDSSEEKSSKGKCKQNLKPRHHFESHPLLHGSAFGPVLEDWLRTLDGEHISLSSKLQ